jgi:hypothetical protein
VRDQLATGISSHKALWGSRKSFKWSTETASREASKGRIFDDDLKERGLEVGEPERGDRTVGDPKVRTFGELALRMSSEGVGIARKLHSEEHSLSQSLPSQSLTTGEWEENAGSLLGGDL